MKSEGKQYEDERDEKDEKRRKQVKRGRKITERYRRINGEISVDKRNISTWRSKE
jgi:hypothetical protein